jgi:hypothetical protein
MVAIDKIDRDSDTGAFSDDVGADTDAVGSDDDMGDLGLRCSKEALSDLEVKMCSRGLVNITVFTPYDGIIRSKNTNASAKCCL